jgi:hypothetical protein
VWSYICYVTLFVWVGGDFAHLPTFLVFFAQHHTGGFLAFFFWLAGSLFAFVELEIIVMYFYLFTLFLCCPFLFIIEETNDNQKDDENS